MGFRTKVRDKVSMVIDVISDDDKKRVDKKIEQALMGLYSLEDITQYENKTISKCIDLLQATRVRTLDERIADNKGGRL